MEQMIEVYNKYQGSVIGTETIDIKDSSKYGMVAGPEITSGICQLEQIIEKPSPDENSLRPTRRARASPARRRA